MGTRARGRNVRRPSVIRVDQTACPRIMQSQSVKGRRCGRNSGDDAADGARRSRGQGGFFGWGWLSAPHLPSRGRKLCPAPAPSEGGAADRSEELPWRCFPRSDRYPPRSDRGTWYCQSEKGLSHFDKGEAARWPKKIDTRSAPASPPGSS